MTKKRYKEKQDRDDRVELEGYVKEVLPGTLFKITCDGAGVEVLCGLSGKLRQNHIRVLEGDRVKIEVSPYDMSRGRIVYRTT